MQLAVLRLFPCERAHPKKAEKKASAAEVINVVLFLIFLLFFHGLFFVSFLYT
jgi:hypothetical protein